MDIFARALHCGIYVRNTGSGLLHVDITVHWTTQYAIKRTTLRFDACVPDRTTRAMKRGLDDTYLPQLPPACTYGSRPFVLALPTTYRSTTYRSRIRCR